MKIYLAGQFSHRFLFREIRTKMQLMGYEVNARWIDTKDRPPDVDWKEYGVVRAREDLEDVDSCDLLILYTEKNPDGRDRGGRHVEFGYALKAGKEVWVVGPKTHVFTYLPEIRHFPDWESVLAELKNMNDAVY